MSTSRSSSVSRGRQPPSRSLSPATTRSDTTSHLDPEQILLTFLETKFHELARRQEDLIRFEHELYQREKSLELQSQQMTWLDGYHRGLSKKNRGGRGRGRGGRGRGRAPSFKAESPAPSQA